MGSAAPSTNRPLRVGIMCPGTGLSQFARRCIDHATRDGLAELHLLILDEHPPAPSSIGTKIKKGLRLDGTLWHLQSRLFPLSQLPTYRSEPLPPAVPRIACRLEQQGKWSHYFTAADVETIKSYNLDCILRFTFGIIRGDILTAARYGVWSHHHDDEEVYRGGPPGFWEIYKGDPVTGALLQRLTDRLDGGIVLKKCYVPTEARSYRRNLEQIQNSSWHMVRWVCLDIAAGRAEYLTAPSSRTTARIYRAPTDLQMLWFWARLARNWFLYKLANQRIDDWNVGVIRKPPSAFLDPAEQPSIEWSPYRERGQMIADPFLMPTPGPPRVLVEELNWSTERGRICELRWPASAGQPATITPIIDEGFHMSYPFILEHQGVVYAIPECADSNSILLYRLDPGSGTWRRDRTLIDNVDALDTTVFQQDDTWWLMHSGITGCGPWSLYLWSAPSLFGPWEPHAGNPVKTDLRGSRPAGSVFRHQGHLYRPAQDGRVAYGGAMCINRIDELTPGTFRETLVRRIQPDPKGPFPDGIHTLNGWGEWSIVDGKRHSWPLKILLRRFLSKRLGLATAGFRYSAVQLTGPLPVPYPAKGESQRP